MNDYRANIAKKSLILAILVCLGKVLGFVKQGVIAWAFGANLDTDVFFAADGFTSTIAQILSTSIAPTVLTSYLLIKNKRQSEDANRLINDSLSFFCTVSILLVLLSFCFSSRISSIVGISYTPEQRVVLAKYVKQLGVGIVFVSGMGVLQGYLNANNRFVPGRLASLFYSVFSIVAVLTLRRVLGIQSLVLGFLAGYVCHAAFMVYSSRDVIRISLSNPFKNDEFRLMLRKYIPMLISLSVVDFGHLIDRIVASSLSEGSVSVLNYGQVVSSDIVYAVVIATVGTVLLSSFTDSVSKGESKEFIADTIRDILGTLVLVSILITALYFVESTDFVEVLLQRGNFNSANTLAVSKVALFYALGFLFMSAREVFIKAHYAYQDMVTPVINSVVGVVTNVVLSLLLSRIMGVSGIALATSISLLVVSTLSVITLKRHLRVSIINKYLCIEVVKMFLSAVFSSAIGIVLKSRINFGASLIRLLVNGTCIVIIYVVIGLLLKVKTLSSIQHIVMKHLKKQV